MSEIVNFPTKKSEPLIWVCECGCCSFELMSDQSVMCALCRKPASDAGGWIAPETGATWEGDDPIRDVSGNGSEEFAKRVAINRASDKGVCLITVMKEDGTISCWSNLETPEQREWADRQLKRVKPILDTGRE